MMRLLILLTLMSVATFGQGTTPTFQVKTVADLVATPVPTINGRLTALVTGRTVENDGGGGLFFYQSSSVKVVDGGTVFKPAATNGRWVRDYSDAFNVKWFGARGDGTTDDTSALQSCLDAALNSVTPNNAVPIHIPGGVYIISAPLVVSFPSRVVIYGDGPIASSASATVIKTLNPNIDMIDASFGAVNVFSMENVCLYGAGKNAGTGMGLLIGRGLTNNTATMYDSHIKSCWFVNMPSYSVKLVRSHNMQISGCGFDISGGGIWLDNSSVAPADYVDNSGLNTFTDNVFYACGTGLYVDFGYLTTVQGNRFQLCGTASDTNGAVVFRRGNVFESRQEIIDGNVFNRNIRHDIYLESGGTLGGHTGLNGVCVRNNSSDFSVGSFLRASGVGQLDIIGNSINDCSLNAVTYAAIDLIGTCEKPTISGNAVYINGTFGPTYGISIGSSCSAFTLGINRFIGRTADINILCAPDGNDGIQGSAVAIQQGAVVGALDLPFVARSGVYGTTGFVATAAGNISQFATNAEYVATSYNHDTRVATIAAFQRSNLTNFSFRPLAFNNSAVAETNGVLSIPNGAVVGGNGNTKDPSAILQLASTTAGLAPPPMSDAQKNAISAPVPIIVYQSDNTPGFRFYENGSWHRYAAAPISLNGTDITGSPTGSGFAHLTGGVWDVAARNPVLASTDFANQGTSTTLLHGNASGNPTWSAVDLATAQVTGNLGISHFNGGTGANASTYWRGDGQWVTNSASSTNGGTVASVDMTVPSFLAVSGNPITSAGTLAVTLSGTRLPLANEASPTGDGFSHVTSGVWDTAARNPVLASSDFSNQGTTTTLLHGNASGNPSFGAVNLAAEVSGNLDVSHLDSGTAATSGTFWRGDGKWAPAVTSTIFTNLYPTRIQVGDYTLTDSDYIVIFNASAAPICTFPTAIGRAGKTYIIKSDTLSPAAVLTPVGGQTIELGAVFAQTHQNESDTVVSDGSNWKVVSQYLGP